MNLSVNCTKSLDIICLNNSVLSLQVKHEFGYGDLKAVDMDWPK